MKHGDYIMTPSQIMRKLLAHTFSLGLDFKQKHGKVCDGNQMHNSYENLKINNK
jgi:hypothetical protein